MDFKKEFDSIPRKSVWKIAKIYGIPEKYINVFKNLYLNSSCCIRTNSGHTDYFNIMTGVQQGSIISPFLFLLTIDFDIRQAISDPQHGIPWNTRCLTDLDFADDLALLGEYAKSLQSMTDNLASTATKVGLRISTEKAKVMSVREQQPMARKVNQQEAEEVENFHYRKHHLKQGHVHA